jgi:hypothetical protein
LAKAQIDLVNPEKSLVATIPSDQSSGTEQTFRYAPLSSGLEIVRKTLGEHEIATVQTTAIDQSAGIVNLTTVLAHSSGEWIASDWPVCALTGNPHRMGKALTYARRYGLFTLAGIAGEDDLDAPDLVTPTTPTPTPEKVEKPTRKGNGRLNGHRPNAVQAEAPGGRRRDRSRPSAPTMQTLGPVQSAELRDRLLAELGKLGSGEDAALWAHRALPEKNRLIAADAQRVEEAFRACIRVCGSNAEGGPQGSSKSEEPAPPNPASRNRSRAKRVVGVIDKSALPFPEPRRIRDRDHVRYVAKQPCLICGRQPCDAHHLRFAQLAALGRKVSDEFTVPLCRGHHREIHRCGDETIWWEKVGIDAIAAARVLWLKTHPLPVMVERTVRQDAALAVAGQLNDAPLLGAPGRIDRTKPFSATGSS